MKNDHFNQVVQQLKAEADRHWRIDPNISLQYANQIIEIGDQNQNLHITALGTMARGDALRLLHQIDEAWETLDCAGKLYREAGDEVGWARTRIGRLAISVELNAAKDALQDAEIARNIFQKHSEFERMLGLETNIAALYNTLNEFQTAIGKYHDMLDVMKANPAVDTNNRRILIYFGLGYSHQGMGNLTEALYWYEQARAIMAGQGETMGMAQADLSIINIAQAQGHTRKALRLLHQTIDVLAQHQAVETGRESWHLIECYLALNRLNDAHDLAQKVIQKHPAGVENYEIAQTLLQLAVVDTMLGDFSFVYETLARAENIFERIHAVQWLGLVHLHRGQAALRQGDLRTARQASGEAVKRFNQNGQRVSGLMARLLEARVELADGQLQTAFQIAREVQKTTRELSIPNLSYDAYLLLGKIAEQSGKTGRAIRYYQIATEIIERIQRSLVLTSRAGFMSDKQESIQALVRLYLAHGKTEAAFRTLERAKSQVWLAYLSQLDNLRWVNDNPETRPLIDELSQLREEHHWHYRAAHDEVFREQQHIVIPPEEAAQKASTLERRLRALTEQLYLHGGVEDLAASPVVAVTAIQGCLNQDTGLIAYYSDGQRLWAFLLDTQDLKVCALPTPITSVENLLDKWQMNINRTLRTVPGSNNEKLLHQHARSISGRLYDALIRPFADRIKHFKRLVVVPYGALHYLPFQLLHNGEGYLIERFEVVILPTASLITTQPPRQKRQALAITYDWDGRLLRTREEAQHVVERFGGQLYSEAEATQAVLANPPTQVLHITAHGQYRIDQPDFSYIQLVDGPLYTDDLFQHDLRYELVTLSACETGRSQVSAGDELIGLGRGFLFAGAGALIASLWRVDEALTLELMDSLYHHLDLGVSKAAALREAQLALMRTYPGLHPAFWGAFELIGNADPLTTAQ